MIAVPSFRHTLHKNLCFFECFSAIICAWIKIMLLAASRNRLRYSQHALWSACYSLRLSQFRDLDAGQKAIHTNIRVTSSLPVLWGPHWGPLFGIRIGVLFGVLIGVLVGSSLGFSFDEDPCRGVLTGVLMGSSFNEDPCCGVLTGVLIDF